MDKQGLQLIAFMGVLAGMALMIAGRAIGDAMMMAELLDQGEIEKAAMRYHIAALSETEVRREAKAD